MCKLLQANKHCQDRHILIVNSWKIPVSIHKDASLNWLIRKKYCVAKGSVLWLWHDPNFISLILLSAI